MGCAGSFELILEVRGFSGAATHPGRKWKWRNCCHRQAEPVYSVGSACPPEQLASQTSVADVRDYAEVASSGLNVVGVVPFLFEGDRSEPRIRPVSDVKRTAYGYSHRERWWSSMSLNSKASVMCVRQVSRLWDAHREVNRRLGRRREPKEYDWSGGTGCNSRSTHIMLVSRSPGEDEIPSVVCPLCGFGFHGCNETRCVKG